MGDEQANRILDRGDVLNQIEAKNRRPRYATRPASAATACCGPTASTSALSGAKARPTSYSARAAVASATRLALGYARTGSPREHGTSSPSLRLGPAGTRRLLRLEPRTPPNANSQEESLRRAPHPDQRADRHHHRGGQPHRRFRPAALRGAGERPGRLRGQLLRGRQLRGRARQHRGGGGPGGERRGAGKPAGPRPSGVARGAAIGQRSQSSPIPSRSSSLAPPIACWQKSLSFGMPSPSRSQRDGSR